MSGSKASNQQRTTKKIIAHIKAQRVPERGPTSTYQTGWNSALETLTRQLEAGDHLKPEVIIPMSPAPGKPVIGKTHVERVDAGVAAGLRLTREAQGLCGEQDEDRLICILAKGHVEAGQPLHSNGSSTWRSRR